MIGDTDFNVSKLYGMLPAAVSGDAAKRTAADNQTVRNVFVIGPDKKVKLILVYPMTTGRNFDEVLRVIDSLQLTAKHKVATPVNWKHGEDVIIAGSVTDDDAKKQYPRGLEVAEALHPHRAAAGPVSARLAAAAVAIMTVGRAAATDIELGRYLATGCMTCHRAAAGAAIPNIYGMAEARFAETIRAYRDRRLPNPVMQNIASRLADEEIAALARYFATAAKP